MNEERYEKFEESEVILRDQLAIDRTMLANDRTILSFARTALTLLITGVSILHFLEGAMWHTVGWVVALLGLVVLGLGFLRYRRINTQLARISASMKCSGGKEEGTEYIVK